MPLQQIPGHFAATLARLPGRRRQELVQLVAQSNGKSSCLHGLLFAAYRFTGQLSVESPFSLRLAIP